MAASEFEVLIQVICNPASAINHRQDAERRLLDMLSSLSTWSIYLPLIMNASDNVCFFIGIGLQRLVWRHWEELDHYQKQFLIESIQEALRQRTFHLQSYAVTKLEQVLAVTCIQSKSFDPVVQLIISHLQTIQLTNEALVGLSAVRTSLDFILSDDPKILARDRSSIVAIILSGGMLQQFTDLSCRFCSAALEHRADDTIHALKIAIDFLKVIISKLPLGQHISIDVLMLLFSLSELGANSDRPILLEIAQSSLESLTDVMSKKYIPAGGVPILLQILSKTVWLLQMFRENGHIDDSPIVLNLLEFISIFSDAQLERCVAQIYGIVGNSKPDLVKLQKFISEFFDELVAITLVSTDPDVLCKVVAVWNRIMNLDNVKVMVIDNMTAVIVPILSHLLQACLTHSNPHMADNIDELIEDLKIEVLVDPHVKEVLSNTSMMGSQSSQQRKNDEDLFGVEVYAYIGSSLVAETHDLITELTASDEVKMWMLPIVEQFAGRCIESVLSSSTYSIDNQKYILDLLFLIRLLPITVVSNEMTISLAGKLLEFAINMVDNSSEGILLFQRKEHVVLFLHCLQILGQLIPKVLMISSLSTSSSSSTLELKWLDLLQRGSKLLLAQISDKISKQKQLLGNSEFGTVILAMTVLFLQFMISLQNIFICDHDVPFQTELTSMIAICIQHSNRNAGLIEVYILMVCCQEMIQPINTPSEQSISYFLVNRLTNVSMSLSSQASSSDWSTVPSHIDELIKVLACLDALTRHNSIATSLRRQVFLAGLSLLQSKLGSITSELLNILFQIWKYHLIGRLHTQHGDSTPRGFQSSLLECATKSTTLVILLSSSLLQSLGRKSYGNAAFDAFSSCLSFLETTSAMTPNCSIPLTAVQSYSSMLVPIHHINPTNGFAVLLFDAMGCKLVASVLELCRIIAESSPANSSSISNQINGTYRLLVTIMPYFSDVRVCGELLQPTLKVGIAATRCYWTKSQNQKISLPQFNVHNSAVSDATQPGENVRSVVQALVQFFAGSLGSNVPPQDTVLALEGMISLKEQHNIFSVDWFHLDCWDKLFTPCLRAIVLHMHSAHNQLLEAIFLSLCDAKVNKLMRNPDVNGNSTLVEFWGAVCQEVVKIANEFKCGEKCYSAIAIGLNHCLSTTGNNQQSLLHDSAACLQELISPATVIISRHN